MKKIGIIMTLALFMGFYSCDKEDEYVYVDGTYLAEEIDFHYGWKGYLEIEIKNDDLVAVDFDYLDADGNLKSQTTAETYPMDPHPTVWLPVYNTSLMAVDLLNFVDVDVYTGATGSWGNANDLMALLIEAAKTGDTSTQILPAE